MVPLDARRRRHRPIRRPTLLATAVVGGVAFAGAVLGPKCLRTFIPMRGVASPTSALQTTRRNLPSHAPFTAGVGTLLASLPTLPAVAEEDLLSAEDDGQFLYSDSDIKAISIMEGDETANQKWAFTVRAAYEAFIAGDLDTTFNIVNDYSTEGWAWFKERIAIGDTPWEEIGYVFFIVVILVNSAQFFILVLEPILTAPTMRAPAGPVTKRSMRMRGAPEDKGLTLPKRRKVLAPQFSYEPEEAETPAEPVRTASARSEPQTTEAPDKKAAPTAASAQASTEGELATSPAEGEVAKAASQEVRRPKPVQTKAPPPTAEQVKEQLDVATERMQAARSAMSRDFKLPPKESTRKPYGT